MKVELTDVGIDRGGTSVLDAVDFTAVPGEVFGLIGPNGAGKTSVIRVINGTLEATGGSVAVGGEPIESLGVRELSRRVATVPQETTLSFDFTVRETVAMGRHPHRPRLSLRSTAEDRHRVTAAMERTDVARFADRPVTAVSGGERQRVLLARAVAQDAPVTLLDEPTASLDVTHAVRTLRTARSLADDGRTVIAAIHDLDLAARFCDRLGLLGDGTLLAVGEPESVLTSESLERAYDGSIAVTRDPMTDTPRVSAGIDSTGGVRGRIHVVGGDGRSAELLHGLVEAGFDVTVGVVPEDGRATDVAEAFDCRTVTAPAFAAPGDAIAAARNHAAAADVVVVPAVDSLGPNRQVVAAAATVIAVGGTPHPQAELADAVVDRDELTGAVDDRLRAVDRNQAAAAVDGGTGNRP